MLHEFLAENHEELAARCKVKVAERASPKPTADELELGIPLLIEQLVTTRSPDFERRRADHE